MGVGGGRKGVSMTGSEGKEEDPGPPSAVVDP